MAQAKHVPIRIRAGITDTGLTTSTKSIRSTHETPAAGYPARSIPLNPVVFGVGTGAEVPAIQAALRRSA